MGTKQGKARIWIALLASTAALVLAPAAAHAVTIDDFSDGTGTISAPGPGPNNASETDSPLAAANTYGGVREVRVHLGATNPGPSSMSGEWNTGGVPGAIRFTANAPGGGSFGALTYDANAAGTTYSTLGLDISGPAPTFVIRASASLGGSIFVTAYTDDDMHASFGSVVLPPAALSETYTLPISIFSQSGANGPADFSRVGALEVSHGGSGSGAQVTIEDISVDRDGDTFLTPADCNDTNPAARPGGVEVPGNGVDEDCSGADAATGLRAAALKKCKKKKSKKARKKCKTRARKLPV